MTTFASISWKPAHDWVNLRYDISHFVLAGFYFALLVLAVVMFLRFLYFSAWFKAAFIIGISLRLISFVMAPFVQEEILVLANSINFFIMTIPAFFLFSAYIIVLFFWGEIYKEEKQNLVEGKMKIAVIVINVFMFTVLFVLYLLDILKEPGHFTTNSASKTASPSSAYEIVIQIFAAALYVLVSFAFFVYGYYIFQKADKSNQANQSGNNLIVEGFSKRRRLRRKIGFIAVSVMATFFMRAGFTLANIFSSDIGSVWWLDLVYYSLLEISPLILMLGTFVDPKKRKKKDKSTITSPLID